MDPTTYRSYRDLPPLAGVASFDEAMQPGLSIEDCVARLKRHHWALRRLHEIFIKRLTAEPIYELKMAFSLHAHYCAEHAAGWRARVGEMREPPLGLDAVPHPALDIFFDEILAAPETDALLLGIYHHALPALRDALERHQYETNRLVDHPSFRLCRFALIEIGEMIAFGDSNWDVKKKGDRDWSGFIGMYEERQWPLEIHAGRTSLVFCDGHAESKRRLDIIGQLHKDPAQRKAVARFWNRDNEPHFE